MVCNSYGPGAQKPEREYLVEKTDSKRGKGYRIVPSLNPNVSAVERALSNNKFTYYMPAEKRLIVIGATLTCGSLAGLLDGRLCLRP
ncbi:hypothetical protein [Rhizobium johnstonii]|uniref:hypothetical protein n=1 Tax=Rhizobium johnstonii TaxID=3019933 RepID=UPI002FF22A22